MAAHKTMFLLLTVLALHSSQADVLPFADVQMAIRNMTQPFVEKRMEAEEVVSMAADKLMNHLALVPNVLAESHTQLNGVVSGAMQTIKQVKTGMGELAGSVTGIAQKLATLKAQCASNRFFVDAAQIPPNEELKRMGGQPSVSDAIPASEIRSGTPVDTDSLRNAQSVYPVPGYFATSLRGTGGSEAIEAKLLSKYGPGATVKLSDVMKAIKMAAENVELSRIQNIRQRFEKMSMATIEVARAYRHAQGLKGMAEALHGMVTGVDYSSGSMAKAKTLVNGVLGTLATIKCQA